VAGEFGERFTDVRLTHAGALCTLYDARDATTGRQVTLKVPARHPGQPNGVGGEALAREALVLSRIARNPHVVALLDHVVLPDGRAALVLARHAGTLADLSGRYLPSVRAVVAIGIKLCAALEAVHAAGALHTDVRPATVSINATGDPVLTGFEYAVLAAADGITTRPLATPTAHTAPELIDGAPITEATDVYGIGVTLYEMLAGHPAYPSRPGAPAAELSQRILAGTRAPLRPEVPVDVADVLGWALVPDATQRAPGPAWLAEGLRHVERSQGWARTGGPAVRITAQH
jgi:serine/threonine-protein kinase PknK